MKSQTIYNLEMKISQMQTVATQQPNRQHRLKALSSLGGNNREMG